MKFVSPPHRGTTCQCRCSGMPAPATWPRFSPMLNPCGSDASRRAWTHRWRNAAIAAFSSVPRSANSPTCRVGSTRRWPGLYGNFASVTNACSSRTRMRSSSAVPSSNAQKTQLRSDGSSLLAWMYSIRHGLHRRSIRSTRRERLLERPRPRFLEQRLDDRVEPEPGDLLTTALAHGEGARFEVSVADADH